MVSHQYINMYIHTYFYILLSALWGSFNNYVDNIRWFGTSKSKNVHVQIKKGHPKNVHVYVGRWVKKITLMSK